MTADYQVIIVDKFGTRINELPTADIQSIGWALNDIGTSTFDIDPHLSQAADIKLLTTEIQIWRNGAIIWWGIPTRVRAVAKTLSFQCQDLLWYFKRRFLGKPGRMNLLFNPEFEGSGSGLPPVGWTNYGSGTFAIVDTSVHTLGTKSAHVTTGGSSGDNFIYQEMAVPQGSATYFLSAEYYIPSLTQGALENRGLGLVVYDPISLQPIVDPQFMMIDASSAVGKWVPVQLSMFVPQVSPSVLIQVRLYGTVPSTNWDAVYLAMDEQINYTDNDMSTIVTDLIDRAQVPPDYSDLNITTSTGTGLSGIKRTLSYKLTDHNNVFDIISNMTKEEDKVLGTIDISMEITATTRTFTVWPTKGSFKPDLVLEWGKNLADFTYELDGEQTSSAVIVQGDGTGPTRLERGYVDASNLSGLILQEIIQAPTGVPIDTLDALAYQAFSRSEHVVEVIEVTTSDPLLIGQLEIGDTVPVRITEGWVNINGNYRIVKMDLDARSDQLQLTLNLPDPLIVTS